MAWMPVKIIVGVVVGWTCGDGETRRPVPDRFRCPLVDIGGLREYRAHRIARNPSTPNLPFAFLRKCCGNVKVAKLEYEQSGRRIRRKVKKR
ncbi:unnamed protein product [Toxocara canis]|uniref:Secreted protein n=1 Tax=Toxocara canis TaxID=6265 RepID=A0A183U050_TOXCA|nr:unnamed protein product [Toxocara canis]